MVTRRLPLIARSSRGRPISRWPICVAFVILTGACGPSRTAVSADLGTAALFQADSLQYTMRRVGELRTAEVTFTFTNRTDRDVAFANCGGFTAFVVERWIGRRWEAAYRPSFDMCVSSPLVVVAGASRTMKTPLTAMPPRMITYPGAALDASNVDGVYRIVWTDVNHMVGGEKSSYQPLPVGSRASNNFTLRAL
jgi:hypothetical protein